MQVCVCQKQLLVFCDLFVLVALQFVPLFIAWFLSNEWKRRMESIFSLTRRSQQMRTMNDWKRTGLRSFYGQRVYRAMQDTTSVKKMLWEVELQVCCCFTLWLTWIIVYLLFKFDWKLMVFNILQIYALLIYHKNVLPSYIIFSLYFCHVKLG